MVVGQGKSLTVAVIAICGGLLIAILILLAAAVKPWLDERARERRELAHPAMVAPAQPRGSPATWFDPEDYPASALRANEEGRVAIALLIDPQGDPVRCGVTTGSGFADLDRATCDGAMSKVSFLPVRDRSGERVDSIWIGAVRWVIPRH